MQRKRFNCLVGLFVGSTMLTGLAGGCRTQPSAPPAVSVTGGEAVCNLGDVAPGSEHVVVFDIQNPRDNVVKIRKVRTDCACTTLLEQPTQIDARGTGHVKVSFKAPPTAIPYESRMLVQTDDPDKKLIWLVIKSRTVKTKGS